MLAVMVLPLLQPTAWFDMWPSWGLYAPSAERVLLLVHRRERDSARRERSAAGVCRRAGGRRRCLAGRAARPLGDRALGAPIYPQSRTQLGVAQAVIARYDLGRVPASPGWAWPRGSPASAKRRSSRLDPIEAAGDEYHLIPTSMRNVSANRGAARRPRRFRGRTPIGPAPHGVMMRIASHHAHPSTKGSCSNRSRSTSRTSARPTVTAGWVAAASRPCKAFRSRLGKERSLACWVPTEPARPR